MNEDFRIRPGIAEIISRIGGGTLAMTSGSTAIVVFGVLKAAADGAMLVLEERLVARSSA